MKGNHIIKAGFGYTVGNYLIKGLAFLTIPIFARIMSTDDYGLYNIFVAYEGIFVYLIGIGFDTSLKKAYFKYKIKEGDSSTRLSYGGYISTAVSIIFINALIWLVIIVLFRNQVTKILGLDFPSIVMLVFFAMSNAVILCYNSHTSITYNYKGFVKLGAINAVGSITLSITLILIFFRDKTYIGRMMGSTVVILLLAIYIWIIFFKAHKPNHLKEYAGWGIKYCLPIIPHGISQIILVNFDRIMIGRMIGPKESGIYSFAYNVFAIVYVTYRSLDPVWGTWFFEKMNEGDYQKIKRFSSLYMIIVLIISLTVILISPELVIILGSTKYSEAIHSVIPIVAGGYFTFLYSVPCQVEYYREKTRHIAGATMCAAIINIILNYIFIRKYGYVAAAYTTLITYILYFLFHFFLAYRIEGKMLFSEKAIVSCSVAILGIMVLTLFTVKYMVIRLGLLLLIITGSAAYLWKEHRELIIRYIHL